MTWVKAETASVESSPSPPWRSTAAASWSMHWATRQAQLSVSLTLESHWEDSRRESHLSTELPVSKQAGKRLGNQNLDFNLLINELPSTILDRESRRELSLSTGL